MRFQLRRVRITSSVRRPAEIQFHSGLNVISGASNTGKTYIFQLIRFAFSEQLPKAIPQAQQYDRLYVVIETEDGSKFTIERALAGGDAILYKGDATESEILTAIDPDDLQPEFLPETDESGRVMATRSSARTDDTLPGFLLALANLNGKRIKDAQASTRNLTFRDLRTVTLLDEKRIISEESPSYGGLNKSDRPAESAVFSLMLTGVDDSAIVFAEQIQVAKDHHHEKAEKIAYLIAALKQDVPENTTLRSAQSQLAKLNKSIADARDSYNNGFSSVSRFETKRRQLIRERSEVKVKVQSMQQLIKRFEVLQGKYASDVQRLSALGEAAQHFDTLTQVNCPVCGGVLHGLGEHEYSDKQGNSQSSFTQGVEAERSKIIILQRDLAGTIDALVTDTKAYATRDGEIASELSGLEEQLNKKYKPQARMLSEKLAELTEKRSEVQGYVDDLERIERYKAERTNELGAAKELKLPKTIRNDLLAKFEFAQGMGNILQAWKYPESGVVQFDDVSQDVLINGKSRSALGKGYLAVTASAFLLALLEFCVKRNLPHPGFVVLDTPVRTFKDRDHVPDDEVVSDEVKDAFFSDLATRFPNEQVIVIENDEPPTEVKNKINYVYFSKLESQPPAGFIPPPPPHLETQVAATGKGS